MLMLGAAMGHEPAICVSSSAIGGLVRHCGSQGRLIYQMVTSTMTVLRAIFESSYC